MTLRRTATVSGIIGGLGAVAALALWLSGGGEGPDKIRYQHIHSQELKGINTVVAFDRTDSNGKPERYLLAVHGARPLERGYHTGWFVREDRLLNIVSLQSLAWTTNEFQGLTEVWAVEEPLRDSYGHIKRAGVE